MADLTRAEALGTGLEFTQHWDVDTTAGSVGLVSGLDKLGEDLAFALIRQAEAEGLRGWRFTPELREDIRIVTRRVVNADSRVDRIVEITINSDDAGRTAEVQLTLIAETGSRGEFVFSV